MQVGIYIIFLLISDLFLKVFRLAISLFLTTLETEILPLLELSNLQSIIEV